jgi:hypothetical protein
MADTDDKSDGKPFDRQAFFKEIRSDVLKKLGLPENTRPEKVLQILQLQAEVDRLNSKKRKPS